MKRRDLAAAAIGGLVCALAGGIAWATTPDTGTINGCYQKVRGTLRVIDTANEACSNSEVAIRWNQRGTKGDRGEPGPSGPQGETGDQGTQGPPGNARQGRRRRAEWGPGRSGPLGTARQGG